jgi:hypothetical protein
LPESQAKIESDLGVVVDKRFLIGDCVALSIEKLADRQVDQLNAAAFSFPDGSIAFDSHTLSSGARSGGSKGQACGQSRSTHSMMSGMPV